MAPDTCSRIVRFGLFELDLKTGELRKKGGRVRLQEQPFQVLAMRSSSDQVTSSPAKNFGPGCGPMRCSLISIRASKIAGMPTVRDA
jgi:hypothetical protein